MKVTDEMVVSACKGFFGPEWGFVEVEAMRSALEAALKDVPEPRDVAGGRYLAEWQKRAEDAEAKLAKVRSLVEDFDSSYVMSGELLAILDGE